MNKRDIKEVILRQNSQFDYVNWEDIKLFEDKITGLICKHFGFKDVNIISMKRLNYNSKTKCYEGLEVFFYDVERDFYELRMDNISGDIEINLNKI